MTWMTIETRDRDRSLHVSQVGKTLEAEAGTGTEPDLGEVDSFPTRLLNQLHLMVVLKWQN